MKLVPRFHVMRMPHFRVISSFTASSMHCDSIHSARVERMKFLCCKSLFSLNILVFYIYSVVHATNVDVQQNSDSLLCRKCGRDIVTASNLNNMASKLALRQRNDTIVGVQQCLIQLFKNPLGQHFELITATSANIKSHGEAVEEHSWFPGYAWQIAVCPQCGAHMGWSFEDPHQNHHHRHESMHQDTDEHAQNTEGHKDSASKKPYSFVGLIYPNLIQEHYADSLIITPKAYRS